MPLTPPDRATIRAFRKAQKWSQAELGAALGASTRAIEEWEGGRRVPPAYLGLALAAVAAELAPWEPPQDSDHA